MGNPPYVRVQEIRQTDTTIANFLISYYRSAVKNFDIYLPFLELGLSVTKNQASFIAPNKWFATNYGAGLRQLVAQQRALAEVVDFRDYQLFPEATNYTCIVTLSRQPRKDFVYVDASNGEIGARETLSLDSLTIGDGAWTFSSAKELALLKRLLGGNYPYLKEFCDRAFQGLRTSDNSVYVLKENGLANQELLPVTSQATGETHRIETQLLKPLLSGAEIRAFSLRHRGQWVLFPYDLEGAKPELIGQDRLLREFPRAWEYLAACEDRLRARERGKMDKSGWWAFVYPKNLDQFEQPKVMLPDYHDSPAAALDRHGRFYSITGYSLTLRSDSSIRLSVLEALLNSKLLFWVLTKVGTALQRGFVRFMPQYLYRLPIVVPDPHTERALERAVWRAGANTGKGQLDDIVYQMYCLTDEEVAIVEGMV